MTASIGRSHLRANRDGAAVPPPLPAVAGLAAAASPRTALRSQGSANTKMLLPRL
jgi:hypothetical protein